MPRLRWTYVMLVVVAACDNAIEPVPVGRYQLSRLDALSLPATVPSSVSFCSVTFRSGTLVLAPESFSLDVTTATVCAPGAGDVAGTIGSRTVGGAVIRGAGDLQLSGVYQDGTEVHFRARSGNDAVLVTVPPASLGTAQPVVLSFRPDGSP